MKVFMFLLSLIIPFSVISSDPHTEFLDKVEKDFESYELYDTEENETLGYNLMIIKGVYKEKPCYMISFINSNKKIKFYIRSATYRYLLNDDKPVLIISNRNYSYKIVTTYGVDVTPSNNSLPKFSVNEFNKENDNLILGNNLMSNSMNSIELNELSDDSKEREFLGVLYYTIISSLVCVGLYICFIIFKSIYENKKYCQTKISMKEIYLNDKYNNVVVKDYTNVFSNEVSNEEAKKEENIIKNDALFEDDIDYEIKDIENYLKDKGFNLDYDNLNEESKNMIMLELMRLKNENKISSSDYYKETYKLWKK